MVIRGLDRASCKKRTHLTVSKSQQLQLFCGTAPRMANAAPLLHEK